MIYDRLDSACDETMKEKTKRHLDVSNFLIQEESWRCATVDKSNVDDIYFFRTFTCKLENTARIVIEWFRTGWANCGPRRTFVRAAKASSK